VAAFLAERGFAARSLAGGLLRWMATQVPRVLHPGNCDRVVQLDRVGKGALAYLVASAGEALVVDPSRHLGPLIDLLARHELRLIGVAETHVHADFLSGAAALASRYGVPHYLHGSDLVLPYDGRRGTLAIADLAGTNRLRIGAVELEVEPTPGHTEGSVSFRAGQGFVLSGDFVFLDSVGRPDLGGRTATWTDRLFDSLEQASARWPQALRVLPAHYSAAGERGPGGAVEARFGELAARNPPLRIRDREPFRAWVASRVEPFPEAYRRIKAANLGLEQPDAADADELEGGRNRCAIS
jgi:glyoxylase-like metal-dependent hydrolase (beta-lactamase superfamily II)